MIKIDKTYIVHFEGLKDRKSYIDNEIINKQKVGFDNFEYIISSVDSDREILKNTNYVYNSDRWTSKLSDVEICNYEVQKSVWKKISESGIGYALIVEDDIILVDDYENLFEKLISDYPDDCDICYISECSNIRPNIRYNKNFYLEKRSRCCVAYVISKSACEKLISVENFYQPVDHHLNFIKEKLELKYYWFEPTLFKQGSEHNYKSNSGKR